MVEEGEEETDGGGGVEGTLVGVNRILPESDRTTPPSFPSLITSFFFSADFFSNDDDDEEDAPALIPEAGAFAPPVPDLPGS